MDAQLTKDNNTRYVSLLKVGILIAALLTLGAISGATRNVLANVPAPAQSPQDTATATGTPVEPEVAILEYVVNAHPDWTCSSIGGTPGHRTLGCYTGAGHNGSGTVDNYGDPGAAHANWQQRHDNAQTYYPVFQNTSWNGYDGYHGEGPVPPYNFFTQEDYYWAGVRVLGGVRVDDTNFHYAPDIAAAIMNAASTLGYLPPNDSTPSPSSTLTDATSTLTWTPLADNTATTTASATGTLTPIAVSCSVITGRIVSGVDVSMESSRLYGVDAISPDDVWAVGHTSDRYFILHWDGNQWSVALTSVTGTTSRLLAVEAISSNDVWTVGEGLSLHWNGSQWISVPLPYIAQGSIILNAVSGISSNDVWAVGESTPSDYFFPLTIHWDGSQWNIVNGIPSYNDSEMTGVATISLNDVWASGYYVTFEGHVVPIVEHWDGTSWQETDFTAPELQGTRPIAIAAVSSNDVWVVGYAPTDGPLTAHWDGTQWTRVPGPSLSGRSIALTSITMTATHDVWVVGLSQEAGQINHPLTARWDGSQWNIVPSPDPGDPTAFNQLNSVTALSPNEAWAVGSYMDTPIPGASQMVTLLIDHWNGTEWSQSPAPTLEGGYNTLRRVAVISPNDIWGVGWDNRPGGERTLTEHWDGSQWSFVPSPSIGLASNFLYGVAAVSPNDVWAAGYYFAQSNGSAIPLLLHWQGSEWAIVTSPSTTGIDSYLRGITAITANDIWAVGYTAPHTNPTINQPFTLHWNGSQWDIAPSPSPNTNANASLFAMSAVSSNDIWAVGTYDHPTSGSQQTLALHWDGAQWTIIQSPNVGTSSNYLNAVAAISATDVWAVGSYLVSGVNELLILHWDGTQWNVVDIPDPGAGHNVLRDVTASGPDSVWAVGRYFNGTVDQSLVFRWNGSKWTPISSPNNGSSNNYLNGAAPISYNEIMAVGEYQVQSATHILAEILGPAPFTDVSSDNPFYSQVQCLVCKDIISGYADGTFRPNNDITRGQLAKIVSNSAAIYDDPGPQLFEDMPDTSTFYAWVNRLANRDYIGGYPCGGPGEPCGSGNLPYFRPNSNATRGQISKIVSNAAGYNDDPAPQIFEDVAPTNPFYVWIQRLASRGIMGGYPCGGPGEPCGSDNKPYFRWGNNATRGQTSKIVANTFFPDCQVLVRR